MMRSPEKKFIVTGEHEPGWLIIEVAPSFAAQLPKGPPPPYKPSRTRVHRKAKR